MKLVYCWINEYINIKNQGFNFGSEYVYSHELIDNTPYITREKNINHIDNYFKTSDNKGFENVTAIVGENGAGKSVLLRYLADQLANDDIADAHNHVFIFENDKYNCHYLIGKGSSNPNFKYSNKSISLKSIDFKLTKFSKDDTFLNEFQTIYFSPIYDFVNFNSGDKLINVSSNKMFLEDSKSIPSNVNVFNWHRLKEIERIIICLRNIDNDVKSIFDKKLKLPEKVTVSFEIENNKVIELDSILIPKFLIDFYNKCNKLFIEADHSFNDNKNEKQKRAFNILLIVWIRSIIKNISYPSINLKKNQNSFNDGNSKILKEAENLEDYIFENISIFENFFDKNGTLYSLESTTILTIKEFIFLQKEIKFGEEYQIKIDLVEAKKLIYNYKVQGFDYLNFSFHDISSGEKAFLNIYSRLFEAKNKYQISSASPNCTKNIFIFIDEGEHGFHVKWQQEYLGNLINAVNMIFQNTSTTLRIQLIFATHSPIVLSDMPHSNVLFFKKDGKEVKINQSNSPKTFAANIHDILKHDFFMDNGFMGEYVRQKINDVIEVLKMKIDNTYNAYITDSASNERNRILKKQYTDKIIEQIISNIDEPILKIKLNEMYHKATGGSTEKGRLEAQNQILEKQISENKKRIDKLN